MIFNHMTSRKYRRVNSLDRESARPGRGHATHGFLRTLAAKRWSTSISKKFPVLRDPSRFPRILSHYARPQVLRGVDTTTLTRQELRNHLEARDLPSTGNKTELAERLHASVLEEQASGLAREERDRRP